MRIAEQQVAAVVADVAELVSLLTFFLVSLLLSSLCRKQWR